MFKTTGRRSSHDALAGPTSANALMMAGEMLDLDDDYDSDELRQIRELAKRKGLLRDDAYGDEEDEDGNPYG
jgi:hypothetical protein